MDIHSLQELCGAWNLPTTCYPTREMLVVGLPGNAAKIYPATLQIDDQELVRAHVVFGTPQPSKKEMAVLEEMASRHLGYAFLSYDSGESAVVLDAVLLAQELDVEFRRLISACDILVPLIYRITQGEECTQKMGELATGEILGRA